MKKHTLWLIELFVWLFVIIFILMGVRLYNAKKTAKDSTYHIFLQDIDGLMKGSPVKMMGVQVGYVTEINIIDDYMYISFILKKDNVTIPHSSRAIVESYGIAGSKSIELYPPKTKADESTPFILVEKTIRSSDAVNAQKEIAKTLITVSNGTAAMLDSQTVREHKQNIQKILELSGTNVLDNIDEKSDIMLDKIKKTSRKQQKSDEVENNE